LSSIFILYHIISCDISEQSNGDSEPNTKKIRRGSAGGNTKKNPSQVQGADDSEEQRRVRFGKNQAKGERGHV
jgi:hypothetical protein